MEMLLFFFHSSSFLMYLQVKWRKFAYWIFSNFLISSYKTAGYHLTRWDQLKTL